MTVRMAHNGSLVALAQVEDDVVSAIVPAVLMHQTPTKALAMGKYFQVLPVGMEDVMSNRIRFDPETGVALTPGTYAAFRFMGVDGQEVEVGKALPTYVFEPPAKVDPALKPVSKTAGERLAEREAAKAVSAARKAQKAADKAASALLVPATEPKVKAKNDSKANKESTSANAKAKIEGTDSASALQKKMRALKAKKEAAAEAEKAKADAAAEVAVEIAIGEAEVLPTTTEEVMAEIEGILA